MTKNNGGTSIALGEGSELPDSGFEQIQIKDFEFQDFKKRELPILRKLYGNRTRIPERFLYTQFTLTNSCGEILHRCLNGYNGRLIEVRFANGYTFCGDLKIVQNEHFDEITSSGFQGEITDMDDQKEHIGYSDLMQGISIKTIPLDRTDWLIEYVSRKAGEII